MSFKDQVEEYFSSATVFSDGLFHGKTILVTGGSGGIGLAVGSLLGRLGANLVIAARKEGRLADITSVLRELSGSKISYFVSDIRKIDEVEAMFEQFSNEKLDAVVNCAGGQFPQPAIDFRRKGWEAVVDTNLNGSWNLMSTAARHWEKRDEGGNIEPRIVRSGSYLCRQGGRHCFFRKSGRRVGSTWDQGQLRRSRGYSNRRLESISPRSVCMLF